MSKAFTRESDDAPEFSPLPPLRSLLPPGAKNYMTSDGSQRMQNELNALIERRAKLTGSTENKSTVQSLDQRILRLQQSLQSAVVVPSPAQPWDQVRFGASVLVRHANGEESHYRIVGVDETDLDRGWVSWLSPIAKALLNARLGEEVRFKFPSGEEQLEVVAINFE